ncbi:NADase-type glycan-binding domain-containing protein [Persicirhabdus sediminis]|uniref:DUF4139 domain-containing protein n=1 Tax=Persicirhabdus sediminis TaxID=454144 RepID=A0A8J7SJJ3_9BACT|nr:DUF4424 family protein [Persicirhabdus sediminis]MBK1791156.1 hypothetical protein [Persicirhabdus sediminis]
MKLLALLAMIVPFAAVVDVQANGGGYHVGLDFSGQVTPFTPVGVEQVQILDETLSIVLKADYAEVNVRYVMENVSEKSAKVKFGFPAEDVKSSYNWIYSFESGQQTKLEPVTEVKYCRNYQVKLNGKELRSTYIHEPFNDAKKVAEHPSMEPFLGIKGWLVSEMKVAKGAQVVLEISYLSEYDSDYSYVSEDARKEALSFKYRLSTGAVWHGPIKQGRVKLSLDGVSPQEFKIVSPVNCFVRHGETWVWEFESLEPTLANDIEIHVSEPYNAYCVNLDANGYYRQYREKFYKWTTTYKVQASSQLADANGYSYSADNLHTNQGEKSFAWSEGVDGHGIGEVLDFTLNKEIELDSVLVENGYTRSEELFLSNSRVKDVTFVVNGKEEFKRTLLDRRREQRIDLSECKTKMKTIQLRIDSVYPGSKYEDTCLSDVSFLGKLKAAPEQYGAR